MNQIIVQPKRSDQRASPRHLRHGREPIAPIDAPEAPIEVEFEGLSQAEKKKVLRAFPGGKRFTLAGRH